MSNTNTSKVILNAPITRVWEALTKPELVKQWQYGTDLSTDWQPGSALTFRNAWEGTIYEQKGTILEIDPPRLVRYTLFAPQPGLEDKPENYFTMTYSLEEANGRTTLMITQDDPREQVPQPQADETENSVLNSLKKLVEG
jgi:uncharacterized protein YndB with AHSA1/START domain